MYKDTLEGLTQAVLDSWGQGKGAEYRRFNNSYSGVIAAISESMNIADGKVGGSSIFDLLQVLNGVGYAPTYQGLIYAVCNFRKNQYPNIKPEQYPSTLKGVIQAVLDTPLKEFSDICVGTSISGIGEIGLHGGMIYEFPVDIVISGIGSID